MTNLVEPIGLGLLGQSRYGDQSTVQLIPHRASLGLSYSITASKYSLGLGLSYTLQRPNTGPLLLYYLITPPSNFALNGDGSIIRPDQITYQPRTVAARTLLGGPLLQGYASMSWQYSVLQWSEFSQLVSFYNAANPVVRVTYPDEQGTWVQKSAVMHPPTYGTMTMGKVVIGVSFTFTRLL